MAQENRLKYYISFEADTKKAKSQIDDMMRSLQQINTPKNIMNELISGEDLSQARSRVNQLQAMLQNAINIDTGRLDLSKFNRSLQNSNVTLGQFSKAFSQLGEEGRQSFQKITEAVLRGEAPLKRQNALFDKMAETMRNTVRWQISATALNAFTSAIQNAYRYAEDLNRSLNDIRIVTGQSVEQMDAFATKANKAARELSVSTKAYADAALIFYQQGLDDNEVLERTNTVMKMSNVTGEAAADVSSYMTAIWNNFDDGSKSLEYYGDVITKLGAATAASSEEIAGGLEKFAAVADTVGLSYEYASAALATIVDRTRQSEDVVGTSLRTIFARLSSLSLGETLEDGVDLTKYSKALDTVGVKILDQNDQLKDMDTILDELGAKWGELNGSQKQALATTVAGVRQYSQLIALMDNYDLFKANVSLAIDSEGSLTEQSEIFEEGWLGAKKRVTAALEDIYNTLLDDKIFIFLTNGVASIVEAVDWLIDRAGGLPAALGLIGLTIQHVFGKDIKQVISDVFYSIETYTGQTQRKIADLMQTIAQQNKYIQAEYDISAGMADSLKREANWKANILVNQRAITDEKRMELLYAQAQNKQLQETIKLLDTQRDTTRQKVDDFNQNFIAPQGFNSDMEDFLGGKSSIKNITLGMGYAEKRDYLKKVAMSSNDSDLLLDLQKVGKLNTNDGKTQLDDLINKHDKNLKIQPSAIAYQYEGQVKDVEALKDHIINVKNLETYENALTERKKRQAQAIEKVAEATRNGDEAGKKYWETQKNDAEQVIQKQTDNIAKTDAQIKKTDGEIKAFADDVLGLQVSTEVTVQQATENLTKMFSHSFSGAMRLTMGLSSAYSAMQALGDESLSIGQKMTRFSMSMTMAIPQLIAAKKEFSLVAKTFREFQIPTVWTQEGSIFAKLTGGATTLKASLAALAPTFGRILIAITAIYSIWKAWEDSRPETKIKKAAEATQEAKKAAAEASKEYAELKSTLDGFKDQYNAIEDMVVGTEEWAAAVSEVNANLQEVIDKYGLMAGEDFIFENGVIVLTAKGEEKVLGEAKAKEEARKNAVKTSSLTEQQFKNEQANSNFDTSINKAVKDFYYQVDSPEKRKELSGLFNSWPEQIKAIFNNQNPVDFSLEDFKNSLSSSGLELLDDDIKNIYQSWFDKTTAQSNFNKNLFATDAAAYVPEDIKEAGLETEYAMAASQRYSEAISAEAENLSGSIWQYKDLMPEGTELGAGDYEHPYVLKDEDGNILHSFTSEEEAKQYVRMRKVGSIEDFMKSDSAGIKKQAEDDKADYKYTWDELNQKDDEYRSKKTDYNAAKSELDEKQIEVYQEYLEKVVGISETMSKDMAVANMRFNEGMSDLLDNWDEYKTKLNASNRGTAEYVETLDALRNTMSEILNVDSDKITEDFLTNAENMALMEQAYLGNVDAIGELQKKMTDSLIDGTKGLREETLSEFDAILAELNLNSEDLKIGMSLDDEAAWAVYGDFVTLMNELLASGEMTAEQVTDVLNGINLTPNIEYEKVDFESFEQAKSSAYIWDEDGKNYKKVTSEQEFQNATAFYVPTINGSATKVSGTPNLKLDSSNRSKGASNASSRRKNTKKADEEIERYHLIKETIEDLNRELDRLGKEKDRAWGNAHLQYIDREIAKTQEAIDAQKEYLSQIEENYGKDRSKLAGYGAQFDENGRLTNYEELMQAQIAKYNAAVRSGSETQQEAAEEQFNNFKKALEQYEETADLFESEYEQLLDLQNQYYDKLLERIQYKVEVDVQISEEADKYYDYILDMLEDKAYSAAEAIAYLGKKTDESLKRIASYQEALNSMFEMHGFGDDAYERFANGELSIEELATAGFTSQEIDMLIEYRGALMEENKQLMEMRDQVMSSLTDTFDEYMDTLDKMIDKFDHLNAITSAYKNIVDIVGKKALGISNDMLRAMDEATVATAENTVKASKDRLDAAEAAMADMAKLEEDYQEAMASANKATSEDEKLYWLGEAKGISDAMEHIEEESRAAKEAFLGNWEEALTTAREVFENNVQLAMEEFENAVSGIYGSLDAMKEAYDQNKVLREQYLEEYERIYELNKLNRDITNSMDDIDSIAAKQALRDLQEEINELQRSGAQISKYDLDMLRMRYELRLAEIALEDAQNAKSQVRMSRDNDGNWSYVYTADEATVADAAQTYEDKMFQMQQTSNDYLDQISEQWIATTIEMEQAYQKIYEDRTLSDEERMAAIDRLTEYYDSRFLYFNNQITNALGNNQILYEEDWAAWANKNNLQIESNDSFLTNFGDTVLGLTTGFETIDGLHQQLLTAVGSPDGGGYLGELDKSYTDWQEDVDRIMEAAGTSAENFGEDFAKVAEDTVQESENIADEVNDMAGQMEDAFSDVVDAVQDWRDEYSNAIADNISANSRMIQSLGALLTRINQTIDAQIELNRLTGEGATSRSGGSGGGDKDAGKSGDVEPNKTNSRKKRYRIWEWSADGSHQNIIQEIVNISEEDFLKIWNRDYADKPWKYDYTEFNTGGYTGAWGSDGRLAMLHEKELVLNKDDTANFLSAINIVRDIVKVVDMNAAISGMGIGALAAGGIAGAGSTIEQSVTIYADFPNATDHSEIELALANLMNSASQYANRKG